MAVCPQWPGAITAVMLHYIRAQDVSCRAQLYKEVRCVRADLIHSANRTLSPLPVLAVGSAAGGRGSAERDECRKHALKGAHSCLSFTSLSCNHSLMKAECPTMNSGSTRPDSPYRLRWAANAYVACRVTGLQTRERFSSDVNEDGE